MRDEKEERKKQARSNKQTRQSNTAHPRQSLFHVQYTRSPRLSLRFRLGGSKVIRGIIAQKEGEPGNEARHKVPGTVSTI